MKTSMSREYFRQCKVVIVISIAACVVQIAPIWAQTLSVSGQFGGGVCEAVPYAGDHIILFSGLRIGWMFHSRFQVFFGHLVGSGSFRERDYLRENNLRAVDVLSITSSSPEFDMTSVLIRFYLSEDTTAISLYGESGLSFAQSSQKEIYIVNHVSNETQIIPQVDEQYGVVLAGGGIEWRIGRSGISIGLEILLGFGSPKSKLSGDPKRSNITALGSYDIIYRFSL